jgi:hypothetical protein
VVPSPQERRRIGEKYQTLFPALYSLARAEKKEKRRLELKEGMSFVPRRSRKAKWRVESRDEASLVSLWPEGTFLRHQGIQEPQSLAGIKSTAEYSSSARSSIKLGSGPATTHRPSIARLDRANCRQKQPSQPWGAKKKHGRTTTSPN